MQSFGASPFVFGNCYSTPKSLFAATRIIFSVSVRTWRVARREHQAVLHKNESEVDAVAIGNVSQRRLGVELRDQAAIERRAIGQAVGLAAVEVARLDRQCLGGHFLQI